MARYDVYHNPVRAGYLLDVQADLLEDLETRVVAPLIPYVAKTKIIRRLNPVFVIDANKFALYPHLISVVPAARLGEPKGNFLTHHDEITAALDMLFQGL
jgi:toxin CcdB